MSQPAAPPWTRGEAAVWLAVAFAALAARLAWIGHAPFLLDEAETCLNGLRISAGNDFPLRGLRTSFGFHNPPTTFYLAAVPTLLGLGPQGMSAMLALAGVGGAVLAGLAARAVQGRAAGVAALALVAFSGAALEHSRRIWGHDLVVPGSALFLWLLTKSSTGRLCAAGAVVAVLQTMHLSAATLWLPFALVVSRAEARPAVRAAAAAFGALAALYAPWLAANARDGWSDLHLLAGVVRGAGSLAAPHPVSPAAAWVFLFGDGLTDDLLRFARPWSLGPAAMAGSLVANALSVVIVGAACAAAVRAERGTSPRLWALAAGAPLLAFAVLFRASVPAYLLPALVPLALLASTALGRVPSKALAAGFAVFALAGTTAQLEVRRSAVAEPHAAAPTLAGIRESLRAGRALAADPGAAFRQDARARSAAADLSLVYLHHLDTGEPRLPLERKPGAPLVVLVDPGSLLPTAAAVLLRSGEAANIGSFRVVVLRDPAVVDAYLAVCELPKDAPR
ncbi:MAG: hypothetical protein SF028_04795 [Candidatus Sumerlaeia bacterium]|nr:hypothetical protein [Candidatus Sumerlaeia bacterium]